MDFPILWVGPAGSGKLTAARAALGATGDPHLQTLMIDDYTARYWEFPTHLELDCRDLSMSDKQVLPEVLNQLLSTRDVTRGQRKLMILRHVHGLSPAAIVRLRTCLEELVWSPNAPAMIWATARTVNAAVLGVMDGFVYRRVPGELIRKDRKALAASVGGSVAATPTLQTYIAEMLRQMIIALEQGAPTLAAAEWIRGRIYDMLGLMATGADLVSSLTWATLRLAATGALTDAKARAVLDVLSRARWVPSYRIPLMLELIVVAVYNALAT